MSIGLLHRQRVAQQVDFEIENLQMVVANSRPKVIVELGTSFGGSINRWLQIKNIEHVVSVDLPDGIHGGFSIDVRNELINECKEYATKYNFKFDAINGDSTDEKTINELDIVLNNRKIDFLFIDACHALDFVTKDFLNYAKFLKNDSIVAFHDIRQSEFHEQAGSFVHVFWNELKKFFKHEEYIVEDINECYKKMPGCAFGGIGIIYYNEQYFKKYVEFKNMKKNVSIVIGTLNNYGKLKECVDSIENNKSGEAKIEEIIIIDNGSSKEESEKIKQLESDSIKIYHYSEALGYSKAFNNGIKKVSKNSDFIVCLNNDTKVINSTWLDLLINPFFENKNVGVTCPTLSDKNNILGFCYCVKKDIFKNIGLLNESFYPGYYEDDEFSNRVRNFGYEIIGISERGSYTFPIDHFGMATFQTVNNINQIIENSKEKYEYYNKDHNICYCIIPNNEEELLKIYDEIYKDDTTLICIINYCKFKCGILKDKRVHIIEPLEFCSFEEAKTLGRNFFNENDRDRILFVNELKNNKAIDLTWLAKFDKFSSMGVLSENILENCDSKFNIGIKEIIGESNTNNSLIKNLLKRKHGNDIGVMFAYPHSYPALNEFNTKIIYSGLDTDGGVAGFGESANHADFLFTPSYYSKLNMINNGVSKSIYVVPHAVNTEIFKYEKRDESEVFIFCSTGEIGDRKGTIQLLEAFKNVIDVDKNVKLILKSNLDCIAYNNELIFNKIEELGIKDYVEIIQNNEGQQSVADVMYRSHCFLYASRADSFGMCVLEAMASGLPVIANDGLGVSEFIEDRYLKIKNKLVPVENHPLCLGNWIESDVQDLTDKMLFVKNNYQHFEKSSEDNAKFIQENFTWDKIVDNYLYPILNVINQNKKKKEIDVFITSFNRFDYLKQTVESLYNRQCEDTDYKYNVYIFEQSEDKKNQDEVVQYLKENYKEFIKDIYCSKINLGQRGAVNKAYQLGWFDNGNFVMLSDQDNLFHKPLSVYCNILNDYKNCEIATGYLSKEHGTSKIINDEKYGTLLVKNTCRAGMMFYRSEDFKKFLPMPLDIKHGQYGNSSWNIGLDWSLISWLPQSPMANGKSNFIYCIPNGTEHVGYSSTWRYSDKEMINSEEISQNNQKIISQEKSFEIIKKYL